MWIDTPMSEVFSKLNERIEKTIDSCDLDVFFKTLSEIKTPIITTGVGGSSIVSRFAAKVLRHKNGIVAEDKMPRDVLKGNWKGFDNVLSCSYSGSNIGVTASFDNPLNKYLLSSIEKEGVKALKYQLEEEYSFVSVAGTFAPMALLFLYYTDNNRELLNEIFNAKADFDIKQTENLYEVIFGYEDSCAALLLESSLCEGGITAVVLCEKYNYCHGRCILNGEIPHGLIYFDDKSELDETMNKEFADYYHPMIVLEKKYEDPVINDFYQCVQAMMLCKKMAECKGIDLSMKSVPDINEVFYRYQGKL